MPVNAIAMPFSFAAAIDSSSLIDPPRLETGVRLAICDSLSLATVVLLNDLGASALESQNRKPDPGFGFVLNIWPRYGQTRPTVRTSRSRTRDGSFQFYCGWEAGIRTPISRVRVCCPTVERPPSNRPNYIGPRILLSSFEPDDERFLQALVIVCAR